MNPPDKSDAPKPPEALPEAKEMPWSKEESVQWGRLKNVALKPDFLQEPISGDATSAKFLQIQHKVLVSQMRNIASVMERFEKEHTPQTMPGKARQILIDMIKIEKMIDEYDARYRTAEMAVRMRELKIDPAVWDRVAHVLTEDVFPLPEMDPAILDPAGKTLYEDTKGRFAKLSDVMNVLKVMDDRGNVAGREAMLKDPAFPEKFTAQIQSFPIELEKYKEQLGKLGSYKLAATFKEATPQLKGIERVMPQIDNLLDVELPRVDWNARPDGQMLFDAYTNLREEQYAIKGLLTSWKVKIMQCAPEEAKAAVPEIQRLLAWIAGHLKRRTDYGEKIGTKTEMPDNIREFLKMAGAEFAEEFSESLLSFKGNAKLRIAKPVVAIVRVADIAMEKTLRIAQEMCSRTLRGTGLKKIPRVDAMLKTMAQTKFGADLIRSTVAMESPVSVLLWGLHMQSADNKMLAAYQWAGFLATSHVGEKLLTSAAATLESMGLGAIARIPGHPAMKFTAVMLVMFGYNKEFNQITKGLEDISRYRVLGPDTTARVETVLSTISGDALLNRLVAGMEETGIEFMGTGAVDPVRDSKNFLKRQQLVGGEYIVDLSRKFTRSFEDWNSVVDREAKNAKNPFLKEMYGMERIDDLNSWSRRQALDLRGKVRMARGWEKQIESIVQKTDMPDAAKNAAKELNLVSVAVGDTGERNDLAVQKRLFKLADLKYAIEDSKDPVRKDLKELWKQYLDTVENMSTDVRLFRHLTEPETPMGPAYHMRINYQKQQWVGDIDSDAVPAMAEQGMHDELVYQLRRREALDVEKNPAKAALLVEAGRKLHLDNQATFGRAMEDSVQKISDFLSDFRRNLSLRKLFEDSGDLAQFVHSQFGAVSAAAQAAAYQLDKEGQEEVFNLLAEELVLPKGQLNMEELLARLTRVRKKIHEKLMSAAGVNLKSVDDPALRKEFGIYPGTKLLTNSTNPLHVEWLGRAFNGEHHREDDITILRINASERGAWSFEKVAIRTHGLEDSKYWDVDVRRGSSYHFSRNGSGIAYSDPVKMDFDAWKASNAQLCKAAQPSFEAVQQEYIKQKQTKEYVNQQLGTQKSELQKEYTSKYETEWKANKGKTMMYPIVEVFDQKSGQMQRVVMNNKAFAKTADELLEENKKKTDVLTAIFKERGIRSDHVESAWKYAESGLRPSFDWFREKNSKMKELMDKREPKDREEFKMLQVQYDNAQKTQSIAEEMMNVLRLMKNYQGKMIADEEKNKKPSGQRIFENQCTVKNCDEWLKYFEAHYIRLQYKDLILYALTNERQTQDERTAMRNELQKKYPESMVYGITNYWRLRNDVIHYPEVLGMKLLVKNREHIDKESQRGNEAELQKEASDHAEKLIAWKRTVYEATQSQDTFRYVPGFPGGGSKWGVFIKKHTDAATGKEYVLMTTTFEIPETGFRYHIFGNAKDVWDFDVRKFGYEKGTTGVENAWWAHLGAVADKGNIDIANNQSYKDPAAYEEIHRNMTRDVLTSDIGLSTSVLRILLLFMPGGGDNEKYRTKVYNTLSEIAQKVKYPKDFLQCLLTYMEQNHPINSDSKMRAMGRDIYCRVNRWGIDLRDFDILSQVTRAFRKKENANVDIGRSLWHD